MRLHYSKAHYLSKLHGELSAAGLIIPSIEGLGTDIWIDVPDTTSQATLDLIASTVAAHDPTPPTPPTPPVYNSDASTINQLADGVAQLRAYLALASPTLAQSVTALKLTIRGVLFLLKRVI